jgi:hypothetical protein
MSSIVFSSSLTIADAKFRSMPHLILRHWLIFQQVCMQLEKSKNHLQALLMKEWKCSNRL